MVALVLNFGHLLGEDGGKREPFLDADALMAPPTRFRSCNSENYCGNGASRLLYNEGRYIRFRGEV